MLVSEMGQVFNENSQNARALAKWNGELVQRSVKGGAAKVNSDL